MVELKYRIETLYQEIVIDRKEFDHMGKKGEVAGTGGCGEARK